MIWMCLNNIPASGRLDARMSRRLSQTRFKRVIISSCHFLHHKRYKDIKFRNALKGMVIGQFTVEEYLGYIKNSSALNKRMMNMVIERLKDQVQLLQQEVLVEQ